MDQTINSGRRRILQGSLGVATTMTGLVTNAFAQQGLAQPGGYDLLITGARVIDPAQNLDKIVDIVVPATTQFKMARSSLQH